MFKSEVKSAWLQLLNSKQYDEARTGFGKISIYGVAFSGLGLLMLALGLRPDPGQSGPIYFNGRKSIDVPDWADTGLSADQVDRIDQMSAAGKTFAEIATVVREEF